MPVEILEHILVHLDDKSLLRASHVCTLFASGAETAFAQKYSNEYYKVRQCWGENLSFHEIMLSKYGDKIRKLQIQVYERGEGLLDLAERTCCNLKSLNLHDSSKIMLSTGLNEARLVRVQNLDRVSFTKFINKNQQLEIFRMGDSNVDSLDVMDGLNNLKTFEFVLPFDSINVLPPIRLIALETLKLYLFDTDDYVRVLRAITCNELKTMTLISASVDIADDVIDQICSFPTLVSVKSDSFKVTEDQLKTLAQQLPHLIESEMGIAENVDHTIQLALRVLPKLTKLSIALEASGYDELENDLKKSMYDFYTRFVETNTEIELVYDDSVISISKDRAFVFHWEIETFELLWMENLTEENVQKVLDGSTKGYQMSHSKITNDCADSTLDVSKFMHKCFKSIVSIDIKSKGPITVNANATRLPMFFSRLKVLKIQLENHSVVDLLQNLDKKFCKQIKELSIDTKNVQNDADQEMEHGNDITDILVKFENLERLEVKSPAIHFDAKHLQSVCPNLNDLRIQRHSNDVLAAGQ